MSRASLPCEREVSRQACTCSRCVYRRRARCLFASNTCGQVREQKLIHSRFAPKPHPSLLPGVNDYSSARGKERWALALILCGVDTLALGQRRWDPGDTPRALLPATCQPSLMMVCKVQPKTPTTLHSYSPSKGLKGKIREVGSKWQSQAAWVWAARGI